MPDVLPELNRKFAERLTHSRGNKDESAVVEAVGVTLGVYKGWESLNGNLPSAANLRSLATYFKVSVDYLLGLTNDPTGRAFEDEEASKKQVQWKDALTQMLQGQTQDTRLAFSACYLLPIKDLPQLSKFQTDAARSVQKEIEQQFASRPKERKRTVTMHVLDFENKIHSEDFQSLLLGMQGAQLIKEHKTPFNLAIADGWMPQNILFAPNLRRGDVDGVTLMPMTLGRSQLTASAATTLINSFCFLHRGYGVKSVIQGRKELAQVALNLGGMNLAFLGIGSIESVESNVLLKTLLDDAELTYQELKNAKVIGDVLFHLIREKETSSGPAWEIYKLPEGRKPIAVPMALPVDDPTEEDTLKTGGEYTIHTIGLNLLHHVIAYGEAQVVVVVKDVNRARILWAALENQWVNSVICTLPVAQQLLSYLL